MDATAIAAAAIVAVSLASLLGAFGPNMVLGVERQSFVCAGTLHANGLADSGPVSVRDATLVLERYRFPVTLWADDDGTAWFDFQDVLVLYPTVNEYAAAGTVALSRGGLGTDKGKLNTISGSLQLSADGANYDLSCSKAGD